MTLQTSTDTIGSVTGRLPHPPLHGVRVIELGRYAAGPACATVLADWGADVVKVEPPEGDPARGKGAIGDGDVNPRFEAHNRTRRSVVLDIAEASGRVAMELLLADADVFVTNLSLGALERLNLTAEAVRSRHPTLIVGQITGYDPTGARARTRSYDHGGYWAFSGVAAALADAAGEPAQPLAGFGDRAAGSALAGAICAALFARERTGVVGHIQTSLVSTGLWLMASDVNDSLYSGRSHRGSRRSEAPIPTLNCYRTADLRWLWLQVMRPEQDWSRLLDALECPWLDSDARFTGGHVPDNAADRATLVAALDDVIGERTRAEWGKRLDDADLVWAPVNTVDEVVADAEARAGSAFVKVIDGGQSRTMVNSPCVFTGWGAVAATAAPGLGEHSAEILAEVGLPTEAIEKLVHPDRISTRNGTA